MFRYCVKSEKNVFSEHWGDDLADIQNATVEPSETDTLLEIFHRTQAYRTVTGGGFDLQQYLVDTAVSGNNTASFLTTGANLYYVKALSLVGAYLSPRTYFEEQYR